ncbi:MAG: hypothetical protein ACO377_13685, partial [Pseudomonadales bacterium]
MLHRAWLTVLACLTLAGAPVGAQAALVGGGTSIFSGNNSARPNGPSDGDWEDAEVLSLGAYGDLTISYTDTGSEDYTEISYSHSGSYLIEFLEVNVDDSAFNNLWYGTLPVSSGATWSSPGRLDSEF